MNKHKHIIVLNGHHYNSKTGERLSHSGTFAVDHKPEASHPTPASKPATPPAHKTAVHKPARHTAGSVKAHAPKPARTLMRHAVTKPSGSLKRHIRVQGHLDTQIKQPEIPAPSTRARRVPHRTVKTSKVHLISHFSPDLFTTVTRTTVVTTQPITHTKPEPTMKPAFASTFKKPRTTAELLDYAIRYADSPSEPEEPVRRKHARKHRRAHAVAH